LEHVKGIQTLITCTDMESIRQIYEREKEIFEVCSGNIVKLS